MMGSPDYGDQVCRLFYFVFQDVRENFRPPFDGDLPNGWDGNDEVFATPLVDPLKVEARTDEVVCFALVDCSAEGDIEDQAMGELLGHTNPFSMASHSGISNSQTCSIAICP